MTAEILLILRIALVASLFVFLGWVMWVFWRELQTNVAVLASRRIPPLYLLVEVEGGSSGDTYTFEGPEITVGRDPACELHLDSEIVSARHARFSFHHSQWWLEDLQSTNGTQLNGEPLTTPTVVIVGDIVTCGGIRLSLVPAGQHVPAKDD